MPPTGPTVAKFLAIYVAILMPFLLLVAYQASWRGHSLVLLAQSLLYALVLAGILAGLARSEMAQLRAGAELRAIVDGQLVGIMKVNDRKMTWVNAALADIFGYSVAELTGQPTRLLYVDDADCQDFRARAAGPLGRGEVFRAETRALRKNGATVWVRIHCSKLSPHSTEQIGAFVDITDLHETRSALSKLSHEQEAMLDNELIGIVKVADNHITWANRGFANMLGYCRDDIAGKAAVDFYPDLASYQHVGETAIITLHQEGRCRIQQQLRRKDGSLLWVDMTGVLLDSSGTTAMWLLVDITQVRQYQEKVEFLAYHDSLTGLPNRLLLSDRLIQSIALAERHERSLAVCYLDLDGFKAINDQYGHGAGDRLLREVARRLQAVVRVNDTVCRVGGDEFVLVLTYLDTDLDYTGVLQRVIAEITKPIALGHQDPDKVGAVSASIGVAFFPADGRDADALIRHADQAMYQAKQGGRARVCSYAAAQARPTSEPAT